MEREVGRERGMELLEQWGGWGCSTSKALSRMAPCLHSLCPRTQPLPSPRAMRNINTLGWESMTGAQNSICARSLAPAEGPRLCFIILVSLSAVCSDFNFLSASCSPGLLSAGKL